MFQADIVRPPNSRLARQPDSSLNYTHVTVLNSATERMRRTGKHSDRYVGH